MTKIQKTFLALLATATAFSASAEGSKEGNFYLSGALGSIFQNKVAKSRPVSGVDTKVKKPGAAFEMGVGAGYYITDSFRTEILFVKPFLNKSKAEAKTDVTISGVNVNINGNASAKIKANSVQLRGYFDLVDISDMGKAYIGAGLGFTNLSGKVNTQGTVTAAGLQASFSQEEKLKNTYNFAWVLAAGAEFNVADNTKLGVEYNYSDHGKIKGKDTDTKFAVRGHSILAKLRFDI